MASFEEFIENNRDVQQAAIDKLIADLGRDAAQAPIGNVLIRYLAPTYSIDTRFTHGQDTNMFDEKTISNLLNNFRELQDIMYDPTQGSWLYCDILIKSATGHYDIGFEYMQEPTNLDNEPISLKQKILFFKNYPRKNLPDWFKEELLKLKK